MYCFVMPVYRSVLNVVEIVLTTKSPKVTAKPLYLVNPYVLGLVSHLAVTINKLFHIIAQIVICITIQTLLSLFLFL